MSTPTDDYEAMAREWWISKFPTADPNTDAAQFEFKMLVDFHEHARSLAHPPTSELVEAGNAMKDELERFIDLHQFKNAHAYAAIEQWIAALAAHSKEVAPTLDRIMDVVDEWLWSCTPDNQHIRHPIGSRYRTDQPAQDSLRARLKTLLP